jgi:hypothetical protein
MLTYFLGPLLAILPKDWRKAFSFAEDVAWNQATALSGFIEFVGGIIALAAWYSHVMSRWVGYGVSRAIDGKMGPGMRIEDLGAAAVFIWATDPVTWLFAYLALEGVVRFCTGAFTGSSCAVLPLYLIDRIHFRLSRRHEAHPHEKGAGMRANLTSYASAIHDQARASMLREAPDLLCFSKSGADEFLEVYASHRKQDWTPPRVVRYADAYYRLEEDSNVGGPRPFCYRLRRLGAGVPGRNVLLYDPSNPIIRRETSNIPARV